MEKIRGFIKVFDKKTADSLFNSGFFIVSKETTSNNQNVYVFEDTPELNKVLSELEAMSENTNEILYAKSCILNF